MKVMTYEEAIMDLCSKCMVEECDGTGCDAMDLIEEAVDKLREIEKVIG